jgi:hypothetical protein
VYVGRVVNPRRWRAAIAVVAALSLFTAVLGCWSLQSRLAAAAAQRPAASAQGTLDSCQVKFDAGSQRSTHVGHGPSCGAGLTKHTAFKSAGMKRDRPPSWARLSPQSVWAQLPIAWSLRPITLATLGFHPDDTHSGVPVAALAVPDILTQFCVDRR